MEETILVARTFQRADTTRSLLRPAASSGEVIWHDLSGEVHRRTRECWMRRDAVSNNENMRVLRACRCARGAKAERSVLQMDRVICTVACPRIASASVPSDGRDAVLWTEVWAADEVAHGCHLRKQQHEKMVKAVAPREVGARMNIQQGVRIGSENLYHFVD
jgi:hypothetical protein